MPPKEKAAAAAEPAHKKARGGGGRGQGKKPSAVNAPGKDSANAPKRQQSTLAALLGERAPKMPRLTHTPVPATAEEPLIDWDYVLEDIVEEWRSQSKKGRYESAMWKKAGL